MNENSTKPALILVNYNVIYINVISNAKGFQISFGQNINLEVSVYERLPFIIDFCFSTEASSSRFNVAYER